MTAMIDAAIAVTAIFRQVKDRDAETFGRTLFADIWSGCNTGESVGIAGLVEASCP